MAKVSNDMATDEERKSYDAAWKNAKTPAQKKAFAAATGRTPCIVVSEVIARPERIELSLEGLEASAVPKTRTPSKYSRNDLVCSVSEWVRLRTYSWTSRAGGDRTHDSGCIRTGL